MFVCRLTNRSVHNLHFLDVEGAHVPVDTVQASAQVAKVWGKEIVVGQGQGPFAGGGVQMLSSGLQIGRVAGVAVTFVSLCVRIERDVTEQGLGLAQLRPQKGDRIFHVRDTRFLHNPIGRNQRKDLGFDHPARPIRITDVIMQPGQVDQRIHLSVEKAVAGLAGRPAQRPLSLLCQFQARFVVRMVIAVADGGPIPIDAPQLKQGLHQMKEGIGDPATNPSLLYAMAAMQMGLTQMKAGLSTGDPDNPGLLEGLQLLSAGLADAIVGLGSSDAPDTLLYGTNAIKEGLTQVGGGTQQMVEGLYKNLVTLNTTQAELEAIAKRGEEFDHLLGRAEDATNQVRFVYQTKPTYNYRSGSKASWVTAVVLSVIFAILLVGGGIMLSRRAA